MSTKCQKSSSLEAHHNTSDRDNEELIQSGLNGYDLLILDSPPADFAASSPELGSLNYSEDTERLHSQLFGSGFYTLNKVMQ